MSKRVTFLFGAGAEIPLGMPTGGRFALDVISGAHDQRIRDRLERDRNASGQRSRSTRETQRDDMELEYRKWLAADIPGRQIRAPGKQELRSIFHSTIENRTDDLLRIIQDIDAIIEESGAAHYGLRNAETIPLGIQPEAELERHLRPLNESYWLPRIIGLITQEGTEQATAELGWQVVRMFVRLALAGVGHHVSARMGTVAFTNDQVQEKVGQQLGQIFQLNLPALNPAAFEEAASAAKEQAADHVDPNDLKYLFRAILINTVARVVDYQHLIEHFIPSIYDPRSNWTRFNKAA